ncbi:MAG: N-6 DNA methylase [Candidatus Nitrosocosmicus sp.]
MDWDSKQATKDPYVRFRFGIPNSQGRADFAFIQHMFSCLDENGQAAILCPFGILFREFEEAKIRENMIREDIIEGIISLPSKIFYGTGIPACILILNKNKTKERKNKIIFIDAAKNYQEEKARNIIRKEDIEKVVSAFKNYKNLKNYYIADFEELKENMFNLNVPRYVDNSQENETDDIQNLIYEIERIEKDLLMISNRVRSDLQDLGFTINQT